MKNKSFSSHPPSARIRYRSGWKLSSLLTSSHLNKLLEQLGAFEGEEALRVELHSVERPGAMADAHDFVFVGPGGDHKIGVRERLAANHQTVIARGLEGIGKPLKYPLAVVMNPGSLAVHHPVIADHLASEHMADALVSQAHA